MEILKNEPLGKHTTFKIGGKADILYIPHTLDELKTVLSCTTSNIALIGNGSNLLVRDGGIRGTVIKICDTLKDLKVEANTIRAGAGVLIKDLINTAVENNLKGLECITGIPGALGGCVYMNASYTKEIKHLVKFVKAIDYKGNENIFFNPFLNWGYRSSVFHCKRYIITEVMLQLEKGHCSDIVKKYREKRQKAQPIEYPSAGSIFKKNNLKDFQGLAVGDAEVRKSFIINKGNATAKDVINLINLIKSKSKQEMDLEIEIVGED